MPELPEVETIVQELRPYVLNQQINEVRVLRPNIVQNSPLNCQAAATHSSILQVARRGKYILFFLSRKPPSNQNCALSPEVDFAASLSAGLPGCASPNKQQCSDFCGFVVMITHLRMSGQFVFVPGQKGSVAVSPVPQFLHNPLGKNGPVRVVLHFASGDRLEYFDQRTLGKIGFYEWHQAVEKFKNFGVEPLTAHFSFAAIQKKICASKQALKIWLLNQQNIAGIGNIYASEILFDAGLHPEKKGCSCSKTELMRLCASIKKILQLAITHQGTSLKDYVRPNQNLGSFQQFLQVYGKKNQPCNRCYAKIQQLKQGQRSTYFCPDCQK